MLRCVLLSGILVACQAPAGPERPLEGERLFLRNCGRCHGPDGRGSKEAPSAKDLTNVAFMNTLSDDRLRTIIHDGKPPAMPAFRGTFAQPSLNLIVAHVRSLSAPTEVTPLLPLASP